MSQSIELAAGRTEELLREAASRQAPLALNCRVDEGWTTGKSFLLGFDPGNGDLIVAYPLGPTNVQPEIVVGQTIGVTFRRAHRKCVFETTVTGRCHYSNGRTESIPALQLEWPEQIFEMQRRLYYRTPVPRDADLPVQVRLRAGGEEIENDVLACRGRMGDVSAGGMCVVLKNEDNPRWRPDTRLECKFVGAAGGEAMELSGQMRYLYEMPEGGVRMGVEFVGLETDGEARSTLDEIIELTKKFQEIERRRGD